MPIFLPGSHFLELECVCPFSWDTSAPSQPRALLARPSRTGWARHSEVTTQPQRVGHRREWARLRWTPGRTLFPSLGRKRLGDHGNMLPFVIRLPFEMERQVHLSSLLRRHQLLVPPKPKSQKEEECDLSSPIWAPKADAPKHPHLFNQPRGGG